MEDWIEMKKLIVIVSLITGACMIFISFSSAVDVQVTNILESINPGDFYDTSVTSKKNSHLSYENPSTHIVVPGDGETTYYAVIAGCTQYEDRRHNLPPIGKPFPESTLKYVYDVLVNASNWEKDHIVLLLNEEATKQNILDSFIDMSALIDGDDVFLFSWNGHGTQIEDLDGDDGDGKDEAICPYDTQKKGGEILNIITDDELDLYFSMIAAEGVFLMFECCMSGGLVDTNTTHQEYSFVDVDEERRAVVMSTPPDKKGWAMWKIGWPISMLYGIAFSNASCDTDDDGWISAEEAFTYVDTAYPVLEYEYFLTMVRKIIPISTVYVFITYNIIFKLMGLKLGARLVVTTLLTCFAFIFYHVIKKQLIEIMRISIELRGAENNPNMCDGYAGDLNIVQI